MSQLPKRDARIDAFISDFLESGRCPDHSMNFFQLDGYLRALAVSPGEYCEDWASLIFNDGEPVFNGTEEASAVAQALEQVLAFHAGEVASNLCNLPCGAVYASLLDERVDLEQWARGFLQGYIVREEVWSEAIVSAANSHIDHIITKTSFFDELDAILYIVSTVADAKYAIDTGTDLNDLDAIFASLPDAMVRAGKLKHLLDKAPQSLGLLATH